MSFEQSEESLVINTIDFSLRSKWQLCRVSYIFCFMLFMPLS